ncbi:MAG: lytic transglycosylase domain-containing protein, partial [Rhodospirillaceae bacterium]|nr:lytic transglycosylase domain-containing protein [Rhodospirillaceae bacterium]
ALKEPLSRKALLWRLGPVKEVPLSFAELAALYRSTKDWPLAARIAERAEDALGSGEADATVVAWFADAPPRSVRGWTTYIAALARAGKADEARDTARRAWTNVAFSAKDEAAFQARFGRYLAPEQDRLRIFLLLRLRRVDQARALWARALLPAEDKAAIALRIAMQGRGGLPGEIDAIAARLPQAVATDADFLFDRLRWNRIGQRYEAAAKVLEQVPREDDEARRWRIEGARVVRELVDAGKPEPAYRAAAAFSNAEGETWATMEFLAGWIALRKLSRPAVALGHFQRLFEKSGAAITRGRGAYWAARAARAVGDKDAAQRWLIQAAGYPHVFYGQLAIAELGHERLTLPADTVADEATRQAVAGEDKVRAAALFAALGDDEAARMLLLDVAMEAKDAMRWAAVADIAANGARRREVAVRAARRAGIRNVPLYATGFPTLDLPDQSKVEPAFALAIIRQESEFNLAAVSPAGARGLMQLMPATARQTARRLKLRYELGKLTSDETYNLRLGTEFLGHFVERYGGLYPLAAAAYNGGPGNLNKWLARYGDPRDGKTDMIDWIESIPFEETRNYVQRVMENLAIYRQRLGLKPLSPTPWALWRPPAGDSLKAAPEAPPLP